MKKSILFSLVAAMVAAFALAFTPPVESMKVDTAASVVGWKGAKVTGSHYGKIAVKSGKLDFNNGVLTGGSFEIDMNSITCEDMTGGGAAKLVGHLKSDDFFGAEKYPTSKFVITQVVSRGTPGAYKVVGDLTIKASSVASTVPSKRPCMVSYLSRWAKVALSVRSLMATTSTLLSLTKLRKVRRPMRPNPLIAMRFFAIFMLNCMIAKKRFLRRKGTVTHAKRKFFGEKVSF